MDAETLYTCIKYVVGNNVDVFVVPRDHVNKIHYIGNKQLVVVSNTSDSRTAGAHWVVFITHLGAEGPVSEYYDSYGNLPKYYHFNYQYPVVRYNPNQHQALDSTVCGHLCIYFVYLRLGRRRKHAQLLSNDKRKNERIALTFFNNIREQAKLAVGNSFVCRRFGCMQKT